MKKELCLLGVMGCLAVSSIGWAVSLNEVKSGLKTFQGKGHDNLALRTVVRNQIYAAYKGENLSGDSITAFDPDFDGIISNAAVQGVFDNAVNQIKTLSSVTYVAVCDTAGGTQMYPSDFLPSCDETTSAGFDSQVKTAKINLAYRKTAATNIINFFKNNNITEIGYMHPLFYPQTICLEGMGTSQNALVPVGEWKPTKQDVIKLDASFNSGNGNGLPDEIMYFLFKNDTKFDCCEECTSSGAPLQPGEPASPGEAAPSGN